MIKFENTEVLGWEHAIRGMRNPMNSWEKSDSYFQFGQVLCKDCAYTDKNPCGQNCLYVGPNDQDLMQRLRHSGTDHRKFMRMITVYVDITAPLYWWKEFDTYKVGTVANSCSTMHKIHAKEFDISDFSIEHLETISRFGEDGEPHQPYMVMKSVINCLNACRESYLKTEDKTDWWQMIQLLPSSYDQKRTVMMNYEVLANIYKNRKNHKLDEWAAHSSSIPDSPSQALYSKDLPFGFCDWIKTLPYSELITGEHFLTRDEIMEKLDKWAKDAEREV